MTAKDIQDMSPEDVVRLSTLFYVGDPCKVHLKISNEGEKRKIEIIEVEHLCSSECNELIASLERLQKIDEKEQETIKVNLSYKDQKTLVDWLCQEEEDYD